MTWIYLSPHLDDVAFSCGGLLWEQAQAHTPVEIWTICAGDPPARPLSAFAEELHDRWEGPFPATIGRHVGKNRPRRRPDAPGASLSSQAVARRRSEDIDACRQLSAAYRHFPYLDCIYRTHPQTSVHLYPDREAIFGGLDPAEEELVQALADDLLLHLPDEGQRTTGDFSPPAVVCPLAIGGHVDHQLLRRAAERLPGPLWYYADFPYARHAAGELADLEHAGWERCTFPISPPGMQAWIAALAAHASQVSSFWPDSSTMQEDLQAYSRLYGGIPLWKAPSKGL